MKKITNRLSKMMNSTRTDLALIAFNGFSLGLTTHYVLDSHRNPMGFYLLAVLSILICILITLNALTVETRVEQAYRKRLDKRIG